MNAVDVMWLFAGVALFILGGLCLWRDRRHPPLSQSQRDHHRASRAYARGEVIKRS